MESLLEYLPYWLGGLPVTLGVAAAAIVLSLPVALALAMARVTRFKAISWPAATFVEVFRGTSAIVQLFWAFYVLPTFGIQIPALATGILVLALNEGAYFSEVMRSAFASIPKGQKDASTALHLPRWYSLTNVYLPQALAIIIPPLGNMMITMVKFTSLLSIITIHDLTYRTGAVRLATGDSIIPYTVALLTYFLIAILISKGNGALERRVNRWVGRKQNKRASLFGTERNIPEWAFPGGRSA